VLAAAALAIAFEHHQLVEAFDPGNSEAASAAYTRTCDPAPTARATVSFPAAGSTYTRRALEGPTTVVSGFRGGVVKEANAAYQDALSAAGYTILRSEVDPNDSEVVFRNGSTSGQVSITQECKGRVRLRITIRPA